MHLNFDTALIRRLSYLYQIHIYRNPIRHNITNIRFKSFILIVDLVLLQLFYRRQQPDLPVTQQQLPTGIPGGEQQLRTGINNIMDQMQ